MKRSTPSSNDTTANWRTSRQLSSYVIKGAATSAREGWGTETQPICWRSVSVRSAGRSTPHASPTRRAPLFASGAEAAAHGRREIEQPGEKAVAAIAKIIRVRAGSAEGPVQT